MVPEYLREVDFRSGFAGPSRTSTLMFRFSAKETGRGCQLGGAFGLPRHVEPLEKEAIGSAVASQSGLRLPKISEK